MSILGPSGTGVADPRFRSGPPDRQVPPPADIVDVAARAGLPAGPGSWSLFWVKPHSEVWAVAPEGVVEPAWYVKVGDGAEADRLGHEAERLEWLHLRLDGHPSLQVPAVLAAEAMPITGSPAGSRPVARGEAPHAGRSILVLRAIGGVGFQDPLQRAGGAPESIARRLGEGLRMFHDALDPAACPYDAGPAGIVARAEARLAAGALQPDLLPAPFEGRDPAEAVGWLAENRPDVPDRDRVVVHGDAGLPNLLFSRPGPPVPDANRPTPVGMPGRRTDRSPSPAEPGGADPANPGGDRDRSAAGDDPPGARSAGGGAGAPRGPSPEPTRPNPVADPMGVVDVGLLGVGDRHRDLAVVLRSWIANYGAELAWRVTDAYGLPYPDGVRLEWYRIADDLA